MASDYAPIAEMDTALARPFDIVLDPILHPELGEIRIARELFAVGRAEPPFASASLDIVANLSRRHAKIFFERGEAYVADLGSKNGTTVDGCEVRERPRRLRNGDTLTFSGVLAYRVVFVPHDARTDAEAARPMLLTLTPERDDLGLEPIVVTTFPYLVSKTDETFARYRSGYAHQVNYLSRRHAHFFVVDGKLFVEDLGSTNGTFVDGRRLEEGAQLLDDGALLAFGGNHFVYRASVKGGSAADPTVTQVDATSGAAADAQGAAGAYPAADIVDADHTTFVAAPHSFLDIFCVDPARADEDEVNPDAPARIEPKPRRLRWPARLATFVAELSSALGGSGEVDFNRVRRWSGAVLALLCALATVMYLRGAPQRDMKSLLAAGRFETATEFADQYLARHPDDAAFQGAGVEALVKSRVPGWIAALKAHEFDRARSIAGEMKRFASHNAQALSLVDEIAWISDLEAFWVGRGGAEAPIMMYRDEPAITGLIAHWNDDPNEHQHALDQIASYVPAFGDVYADTLSHLRTLQMDDSVYVAALDRLKTAISAALDDGRDDRLDALSTMLADYGERYPRLAGLDRVRSDLQQYRQLVRDARSGHASAVADAVQTMRFETPPFQARVPELMKLAAPVKGSTP
jgi:pSer/pThr/pTyr-binding forkhead associated (FHA) protein